MLGATNQMSELPGALPRGAEPWPLLCLPPRGVQEGLPAELSRAYGKVHESQVGDLQQCVHVRLSWKRSLDCFRPSLNLNRSSFSQKYPTRFSSLPTNVCGRPTMDSSIAIQGWCGGRAATRTSQGLGARPDARRAATSRRSMVIPSSSRLSERWCHRLALPNAGTGRLPRFNKDVLVQEFALESRWQLDICLTSAPSRVHPCVPRFPPDPFQGAAEDRGTLAALDRELQELSATDMRQAALQVRWVDRRASHCCGTVRPDTLCPKSTHRRGYTNSKTARSCCYFRGIPVFNVHVASVFGWSYVP